MRTNWFKNTTVTLGLAAVLTITLGVVGATADSSITVTTTTQNPGTLPQTVTEPSLLTTPGSDLSIVMTRLWKDILTNNTHDADALLFPEQAYVKLKAIPYPVSDYEGRLRYLFNLDISAYRSFLIAKGTPVLIKVTTSVNDAQWIPVGACYNKIGYWHLPGPRFVYRYGPDVASLGVLSMISWRGQWYPIHLGQYVATGSRGQIYDYSVGPGTPGPPGSC